MSEATPDKKQMLSQFLKLEAFFFIFGGVFLSTKSYFSEIIMLDVQTDMYLGYGLIFVGFINIFIANKFFGTKTTK